MRNDRFSATREITSTLHNFTKDPSSGGPVLFTHNGMNYIYNGEGHTIFLGVSGCGKSRRGLMPMVHTYLNSGESFFVIDPKGEIYQETASIIPDDAEVHVIDLRSILTTECWNPLRYPMELYRSGDPAKKQSALELVDELAHALYPDAKSGDPFWILSARSLFVGLVNALLDKAKAEEISLASVYQMIIKGEARIVGANIALKSFVDSLDPESTSSLLLQSYVNTANDTRAGIRSTALEGLSALTRSEAMLQLLSFDDINIGALDCDKQTCIYLILPDENRVFSAVAGALCSQLSSHFIRLAHEKYNNKLPRRLNVCADELGNVGQALDNLPFLMSAGRSRNVRMFLVLQSLSQLKDIYGESAATTILSNASVTVAYRINHWDTLIEFSRKSGERVIESGTTLSKEPLLSPNDLGAMETGQAFIIVEGRLKFVTWLPDYRQMFDFLDNCTPPKKTAAKHRAQPQTFDVIEYIRDFQKKKLIDLSNRTKAKNPTSIDGPPWF